MKIATWNVNGIRARIKPLLKWLEQAKPDVVCLQEIKCADAVFPTAALENIGYNVAVHGQKGFNGVAIISRFRLTEINCKLPGDSEDNQSRYIEAMVINPDSPFCVASIYLPNGNPVETVKFTYKLNWMKRLEAHAESLLNSERRIVLAGDFNIIPEHIDCHSPKAWTGDALFHEESRFAFRRLKNLGFRDAFRACDPSEKSYTFWDYQSGAWPKNEGIRIDHLMLSPQAVDQLIHVTIEKYVRGQEQPSDHVPIYAEFL
ncbi:MAG: Exodeoxyribonuclease III [Hyphomicrobiaceae bacterium hypho_1]